jgi:Family of unknown function (DUF6152)
MKRRTFLMTLPISGLALAMAKNSLAHHGWSSFDESRPIYLEGVVKSAKWQNPHAEIMITLATDLKLPADLAKRSAPEQTAKVDGAKILSTAALPKKRGDWVLELSPMSRIEAWKVSEPKVGDTIAAVGYTFKDEKGASLARIEYLMVGEKLYGLRSMPV